VPARRIPLPARLLERPFTAADAAAAGLGQKVLRGPSVRRLGRGLYVAVEAAETPSFTTMVAAFAMPLPPDVLAAGVTALRLYGVEVGREWPLCFGTTAAFHGVRRNTRVSVWRKAPPSRGLAVAPEHAFLGAAGDLDLVELVTAGDWLVRRKLTTPARLVAYTSHATGRHVRVARRAAALVRSRVDSPKETVLRLVLVLAGLPEPVCNQGIGTEEWFLGRGDLVYQAYKVVLEYEGDQHRTDKAQWNIDIGRYEEFTGEGYNVIRITARMRHPRSLVLRVDAALRAGGYDGPPPVFSEEWRRLFA
jgi:hypothetical protein